MYNAQLISSSNLDYIRIKLTKKKKKIEEKTHIRKVNHDASLVTLYDILSITDKGILTT